MNTSVSLSGATASPRAPGDSATRPHEMRRSQSGHRPMDAPKLPEVVPGNRPMQLPLMLVVTPVRSPSTPRKETPRRSPLLAERFAGMDARMTTSDVVRVVGVNRSTLFRWCKKGLFPARHISGGWLRSDIEKWFATKADRTT